MPYIINNEKCVVCGGCAEQCPAEAIELLDEHYVINAEKCLSCGGCAAQCPAEAIEKAEEDTYVAEGVEELAEDVAQAVEEAESCYKINYDKCLSCGGCAEQCPAEAIYMDEESRYVIDPEKCLRCGGCAEQCPAEAISLC